MTAPLPLAAPSAAVPNGGPALSKGTGKGGAEAPAGASPLGEAAVFAALAAPNAAPVTPIGEAATAEAIPLGVAIAMPEGPAAHRPGADGEAMSPRRTDPSTVAGVRSGVSLGPIIARGVTAEPPSPILAPLQRIIGIDAGTVPPPPNAPPNERAAMVTPEPLRPGHAVPTLPAAPLSPGATGEAVSTLPPSAASPPTPEPPGVPTPVPSAVPSAPTAPAAPAGTMPPDPAQQLVRAVAHAPGERVVEVRLDPPQLGRVRIEFDFTGDAVRAVVSAAEPEALTLLRRGGAGLARELAEMGYPEADIEYAEDRTDGAGTDEPTGRALALPTALSVSSDDTNAAPTRTVRLHDGALDITL